MTAPSQPAKYTAWGKYFSDLIADQPAQEVLDKLKLSQTMVSRWARGSARPADIGHAKQVATQLGGNPEDAERAIRADSITVANKQQAKPAKKVAKKAPARKRIGATGRTKSTPKAPAGTANNVSGDPLELVRTRRSAAERAEKQLDEAVSAARDAGVPWREIASELG